MTTQTSFENSTQLWQISREHSKSSGRISQNSASHQVGFLKIQNSAHWKMCCVKWPHGWPLKIHSVQNFNSQRTANHIMLTELTLENLRSREHVCGGESSGRNSQNLAHWKICCVKWPRSWLLRISDREKICVAAIPRVEILKTTSCC